MLLCCIVTVSSNIVIAITFRLPPERIQLGVCYISPWSVWSLHRWKEDTSTESWRHNQRCENATQQSGGNYIGLCKEMASFQRIHWWCKSTYLLLDIHFPRRICSILHSNSHVIEWDMLKRTKQCVHAAYSCITYYWGFHGDETKIMLEL